MIDSRPAPLVFALPLALVLFGASPAPAPSPSAAPPPARAAATSSGSSMVMNDIRVETQETNLNENTGNFTMPHAVRFNRPGSDASADRATGNSKRGTITLIGHVVVHDSGNGAKALGQAGGNEPATLTSDRLEVDSKSKVYVAIGSVHFSQGNRNGTADRGTLDRGRNTMRLEGNVTLTDPQSALTAATVDDNLSSKDIVIVGSPAVLKQTPPGASGPDTVQSDRIDYNQNSGDFTMPGKASFSRPGTDATGDHAAGNTKSGTLALTGNVVVHDSGSAPEAGSEKTYGGNGPATVTSDALNVDAKRKVYTANGNVHFTQGPDAGRADHATLDRGNNMLHLDGNVKLTQDASSMSARTVDYNLLTKDVRVVGAPIVIKQPVPSQAPKPAASAKPKKKKGA